MAELTNYSKEDLTKALRVKNAEEKRTAMQATGITGFKNSVSKTDDLETLYKLANSFKARVDGFRRVLNPSTGTRGRKAKKVAK